MKVTQIATILNEAQQEIIGEAAITTENLENVVDMGKQILEATDVDNYVRKLIDKVGRMIFVDRVYNSTAPDILTDSWEYGSAMQKVRCEMPDAVENDSWKLTNGQSYDPFVFTAPDVQSKFYDSKVTYEVQMSFTEMQVKSAFNSPAEMNSFFAMIENRIRFKLTLSNDILKTRTVNNLIAEKIHSNNNVVNLLTMYNAEFTQTLKADHALMDKDFLRYAIGKIKEYIKYIQRPSMLFNDGGYTTFTPESDMKMVLLSRFVNTAEVYLQSDTFHNDLVKLSGYSEVPYWQGSGTSETFDFAEISKIDVTTASGNKVSQIGIIGTIFDRDACMVCNANPRVTSIYNPKGEYWNYFYKYDASYFNDTMENCVVFIVADTPKTV
jgi:hypothetical protein|nr:MAG TPA: major capsid protein [Caudoviricetes sp.]